MTLDSFQVIKCQWHHLQDPILPPGEVLTTPSSEAARQSSEVGQSQRYLG